MAIWAGFDFPPQKIHVEANRPDGAYDVANVSVVAVVPYMIMKTAAMERGKAKDAYDIYFLLKHYRGGIKELAKEFQPFENRKLVQEMKEKLVGKFASADHAGPKDVADLLISETPKPVMGHSVTLEKLLVDLFSKKLTGKLISRSEYPGIYEGAFSRYSIDETKMFRYARRRHLESEIRTFIKEETNVELKYS